ncbi:SGNH/GDSL hydrolase family protein [Microbacterium sp.]|uniref:SGNH/GDSL hydrolase family protein n=1 Tax=Microbacterium sp. TaxID=51671 RepID=UPI003A9247A3
MSARSIRDGRAPRIATATVLHANPTGFAAASSAPSPARRALIILFALLAALVLAVGAASPASAAGKGKGGGGGGGGTSHSTSVSYAALGDSYAAGQGAGSYLNTTCYVSSKGYPKVIDASTSITLAAEPACSGDATAQVIGRQVPLIPTATQYVTLTVGGNDVDFENVMQNCFVLVSATACTTAIAAGDAMVADGTITARISATVTAIKTRAPGAKVIVTGYPQLFAPTYTKAYAQQVNTSTLALNAAISTGATAAGARYVDVVAAFAGHGIGSSSPWINNWNWLNFSAGFHPNATGYTAYAAAIKTAW